MAQINIYRRSKDIPLPKRMTPYSAGLDIYCEKETIIPVQRVTFIETGLIIQPPAKTHIKLFLRSGLSVQYNMTLINSVGIVDEDYCGKGDYLKMAVFRYPVEGALSEIVLKIGERVGQILFERTDYPDINWVEQISLCERQSRGGFGSTGTL